MENSTYYLGIDIGGTKCAVVVGNAKFEVLKKVQFPTRTQERGYEEVLQEFHRHITELFLIFPKEQFVSIGISCGGPLDSVQGVIQSPPNLPGWDEVPIIYWFRKQYGIPTSLQNDANAGALAEWMMGAGQGTRNMVFLTFGTGMGAGLILNGQLYAGTNDLGGEVGHIRLADQGPVGFGKAGSFEGFCSGGGIAQLAQKMVRDSWAQGKDIALCRNEEEWESLSAKTVALAAADGDALALEVIRISGEFLGRGLAVLVDILNPECIVIGSIYARNESLFKPFVDRILQEEAIPGAWRVCQVKPAALGEAIGDFAALCVAIYSNQQMSAE